MQEPRPESRIKSLENRATTIEATLIELSSDTAEELKAIRQDNKALFEHVQQGFDQAHAFIQENIATKQDISRVESTMATMATKDELTAMEVRLNKNISAMKESLLDAIKQLQQQKPSE